MNKPWMVVRHFSCRSCGTKWTDKVAPHWRAEIPDCPLCGGRGQLMKEVKADV